jgi:hypothetical protein
MLSSKLAARFVLCVALAAALPAFAQSGLRLPQRGESGLDPSFARGWLAPDYDHFGFAQNQWRDGGFTPGSRMNWSYSFSARGSLGMAVANSRDLEQERQLSVIGRYWLSPDWALNAEMSREPSGLRVQDFRIGVQRRF